MENCGQIFQRNVYILIMLCYYLNSPSPTYGIQRFHIPSLPKTSNYFCKNELPSDGIDKGEFDPTISDKEVENLKEFYQVYDIFFPPSQVLIFDSV